MSDYLTMKVDPGMVHETVSILAQELSNLTGMDVVLKPEPSNTNYPSQYKPVGESSVKAPDFLKAIEQGLREIDAPKICRREIKRSTQNLRNE